jgi:hypothetical protein
MRVGGCDYSKCRHLLDHIAGSPAAVQSTSQLHCHNDSPAWLKAFQPSAVCNACIVCASKSADPHAWAQTCRSLHHSFMHKQPMVHMHFAKQRPERVTDAAGSACVGRRTGWSSCICKLLLTHIDGTNNVPKCCCGTDV